jgi:hypothetical protein
MKNETRVARYRVSLNPRELWPELSEGSFFAVTEAIAEVTAGVLNSPRDILSTHLEHGRLRAERAQELLRRLLRSEAYPTSARPRRLIRAGRRDNRCGGPSCW